MSNTILFGNINRSLGTRDLGAKIRLNIVEKINNNDKVYLDFEGVDVVTNSFANECFSKLKDIITIEVFKSKIAFINTNDFVQRVIISAM